MFHQLCLLLLPRWRVTSNNLGTLSGCRYIVNMYVCISNTRFIRLCSQHSHIKVQASTLGYAHFWFTVKSWILICHALQLFTWCNLHYKLRASHVHNLWKILVHISCGKLWLTILLVIMHSHALNRIVPKRCTH